MCSNEFLLRMILVFRGHRHPVDDQVLIDPGDDLFFVGSAKHVVSSVALANEAPRFGPVPEHSADASEERAVTSSA